jgi:hypothetical protein
MAFDNNDEPVLHVGQMHGIRMYNSLAKAKAQRKRWVNGTRYSHGTRLYNWYPNAKVFECTYVAGVLMTKEIYCE